MIPATSERVPQQTCEQINQRLQQETHDRVARFRNASPAVISQRLRELEQEWDIERVLEANAATVSIVGLALGATLNRRWFVLPAIVGGFLLQHAVQGWCPPLGMFRRLGVRTQREIDEERFALKVLRGDFRQAVGDDLHVAHTDTVLRSVQA
jgi:hypothetical protein